MALVSMTCFTIHCDGDCDDQGWDDEGTPHFESAEEVTDYILNNGWTLIAGRALCPACLNAADCAATDHQFGDWEHEELEGVPFRRRWCEHCGQRDQDPPRTALLVLLDAARLINGAAGHLDGP